MSEQEDLIQSIATEIVDHAILGNFSLYALIIAVTLVSNFIYSLVSSYSKKRGENLATKADFDEILRQLKETTATAEEIRGEIHAKLDESKSVRSLIREKLEAIFEQTFVLELWLEQVRDIALDGKLFDINSAPINKIEMYQSIYFKEVKDEFFALQFEVLILMRALMDVTGKVTTARSEQRKVDYEAVMNGYSEILGSVKLKNKNLREKLLEKYASPLGF